MNRRELVKAVLQRPELAHLKQKDADSLVTAVIDVIKSQVCRGKTVCLSGFGTFSQARHSPRAAADPNTGEYIIVPAKTLPHFRSGKDWREALAAKAK